MRSSARHVAQRIGADERTVRRLIAQGTVRCTKPGPRQLEISQAEMDYLGDRWELLARLRASLRTEPNVRFALLFGSTARGEEQAGSDLDLLVDLDDPGWSKRQGLNTRLESSLRRSVDLVVLDRLRDEPALLVNALSDGRVLVDREGTWPALVNRVPTLRRRARQQAAEQEAAVGEALDAFLVA